MSNHANPAVIGMYTKQWGSIGFSALYQEEFAQQQNVVTSIAVPLPKTSWSSPERAVSITSSMWSSAINSPSRMCARRSALSSRKRVRRRMTTIR